MAARYLHIPIGGEVHNQEVNTILRRSLHLSGTVLRRIKWLPDGIMVRTVSATPLPADGPADAVKADAVIEASIETTA